MSKTIHPYPANTLIVHQCKWGFYYHDGNAEGWPDVSNNAQDAC